MIIDYSKFSSTSLNTEPFDHLILEDFINSKYADKVYEDFPEITSSGSFPLSSIKYGAHFGNLISELESQKFRELVEEKFGVELEGIPTMITARGMCAESNGKIHVDSKGKVLTFLIYFNKNWETPEGKLRLLNGEQDIEDYFAEVTPSLGTLIAFRCTENAWHGHKPFSGIRKSIQLNWVKDDHYLAKEQRRHKVSAFFKKVKRSFQFT